MESLLEEITPFGRFQKLMILFLSIIFAFTASNMFFIVFTSAEPELLCNDYRNFSNNSTLVKKEEACKLWKNLYSSNKTINTSNNNYECFYDKNYFDLTITSEWNLVCDKKYLASLTQTIYMVGTFFSIFFGYLADFYGRRRTLIASLGSIFIILLISEILQLNFIGISVFFKYIIFCINLFLNGLFIGIIYCTLYVLLMELTTSKYQTISSTLGLCAFNIGELIVLIVAYFIRNWHIFNWVLCAYAGFVFILAVIFLPESPKWQISKGLFDDAEANLTKIAKINKKNHNFYKNEINNLLKNNNSKNNKLNSNSEEVSKKSVFYYACKPVKSMIKTVILMYIFVVLALVYFGISFGVTSLNLLNPYMAYLLSVIAETIGYSLCIFNEKIGKRNFNALFIILSSIGCLFVGITPSFIKNHSKDLFSLYSIVMLSLITFSKCMISAAFNNIWIYSSQLYPTSARASMMVFLNGMSRIGGLIAPMINLVGRIMWEHLPYVTFSIMSFLAGISTFILPKTSETFNYH